MGNTLVDTKIKSEDKGAKKIKLFSLLAGKNLKILIIIGIMTVALILLTGINNNKGNEEVSRTSSSEYLSTMDYCAMLETKLEGVISSISGAGNVDVMVMVDGSPELIFVSDTDNKTSTNSSGSTTTTSSSPIIISSSGNSNAIVKTETLPKVKGVVVVSSGASNVAIKLDILKAVSTVLDISTEKITILKGV